MRGDHNMKCPNCGIDLPDTVTMCYSCKRIFQQNNPTNNNYIQYHTTNSTSIQKKSKKKTFIVVSILSMLIVAGIIVTVLLLYPSPKKISKKAVKMIEADINKEIRVSDIYYNKEENTVFVIYNGDSAFVHMDTEEIGYKHIAQDYLSRDAKSQKEAQKYYKYATEVYDTYTEVNFFYSGSVEGWEKIE